MFQYQPETHLQSLAIMKSSNKRLAILLIAFALIGALFLMTSCGGSDDSSTTSPTLSDQLNIYSQFGYLSPEVIAQFESEFGVEVNLDIYQDEDFMISVVQSNPAKYDLVFPTESMVSQMIRMKLLCELDLSNIPSLTNIGPEYLNMAYDPGNNHSIPFLTGTTGIAFNTSQATATISSWATMWDAKYNSKISMSNNPHKAIGATLKYLGYPLNTPKDSAYAEAKTKMLAQIPLLAGFLNAGEAINRLKSGDIWLAQMANGDALTLKEEMPEIAFVIPTEGSDYYMGCMAIPSKALNKRTAEAFIDFMLRPEIHAQNTNANHYACPNEAAMDSGLIDPGIRGNPGIYPPPLTKVKLDSWDINPGPINSLYNKTWSEIRGLTSGNIN